MTLPTIVILIIIGAVAFLAWSLYYGIRCAIDEDFAEECRKFQEEYQRKQKAKQEENAPNGCAMSTKYSETASRWELYPLT